MCFLFFGLCFLKMAGINGAFSARAKNIDASMIPIMPKNELNPSFYWLCLSALQQPVCCVYLERAEFDEAQICHNAQFPH